MIKTTAMILEELNQYASPADKLTRMVRDGQYIPITKGLYETDRATPGYLLAGSLYGPSYLSFEFALGYYGMIPEAVYTFTSATFEKRKKKSFTNPFGTFTYQDVPSSVYALGIEIKVEGAYSYMIASREKALCDQLYKTEPLANNSALLDFLFMDLRLDEQELKRLSLGDLGALAAPYPSRNVKRLFRLMGRMLK